MAAMATNTVVEGLINKKLPAELFEQIFAFCNVKNDLLTSANVCHLWRDIICEHLTEFNVELRGVDDVNELVSLLSRAEKVVKLRVVWKIERDMIWRDVSLDALNASINALNEHIIALQERKPRFQCVTVIGVVICHDDLVNDLAPALLPRVDNVTQLTIRTCNYFDEHDDDCPVPLDRDIPHESLSIATSLGGLNSFSLLDEQYDSLVEDLLTLVRETSNDTLTRLEVRIDNIFDDIGMKVLQVLNASQNLKHLKLSTSNMVDMFTEGTLEIIYQLSQLESLDIRERERIDSDPRIELSDIADIKRECINLSNILISTLFVRAEDDLTLLQIFSSIHELCIIELYPDHLWSLVRQLRECSDLNVNTLDVSPCETSITDDILLSLVQALRNNVTHINASDCHHLTNEGVVSLIESSEKLQDIDVVNVENISDDLIELLHHIAVTRSVRIGAHYTALTNQIDNGIRNFRNIEVGGITVMC